MKSVRFLIYTMGMITVCLLYSIIRGWNEMRQVKCSARCSVCKKFFVAGNIIFTQTDMPRSELLQDAHLYGSPTTDPHRA